MVVGKPSILGNPHIVGILFGYCIDIPFSRRLIQRVGLPWPAKGGRSDVPDLEQIHHAQLATETQLRAVWCDLDGVVEGGGIFFGGHGM